MSFRATALLLFAALAVSCAPAPPDTSHRQWLDGGAIPSRYAIAITPDDATSSFAGEETITISAPANLAAVTMNALDLSIDSASIDNAPAHVQLNQEAQTLTLTPAHPLTAGQHSIRIAYRGKIYNEAYGFFRTTYVDHGQTKHMLITQFEPADARRLAPMWDQPNRRAVFALTVTAPAGQSAVSNMPAANVEHLPDGRTRTHFADTPAMASYLVFLGVGDIERITTNVDGVEIGVVTRRGASERGRYALQSAAAVLRYYNQYFGIRYPLPKLDMIAAPGAGGGFAAMENWGAILYFDQYLLIDDNLSSEADRQDVFNTVAHEMAHQWFGDLVTMNWWNDLWLNEGFASWMASKATDALHPEWRPWLAQLAHGTADVMSQDARAGTHPVVQEVNTIDEANLAFDDITYDKGLAVIRMIEAYVGEDAFRRGVHNYLNAHRLGNSVTADLWSAVQAASGEPVLEIARDFTTEPGYPVVSASGDCNAIRLAQRRFALDESARTDQLWAIPIVARRAGGAPVRSVMPARRQASIALPGCGAYLVNAGQTAYFRVLYDGPNFQALARSFATLDADDQLGMLLDYWAFARSGDAPFSDYLELAQAAPADADPLVAIDTANSMTALFAFERGRPAQDAVATYGRGVLAPYFARIGWTPRANEAPNVALLRARLISALGELGDAGVIAEARRRVMAARHDPSVLPAAIRDAALEAFAYNASPTDYAMLLSMARSATDFVEQRRLWTTLGASRDEALAQRTLELTLGEDIPRQLRQQVVSAVGEAHPRLAWDFLVAHRAAVEAWLEPPIRISFPAQIASGSADPAMARALELYAANFPTGAHGTVTTAESEIRLRAATVVRLENMENWMRQHPPGAR